MSFAIITCILGSRSHSKSKIEVFRKINSYIDHSFEEVHPALEVCKENRPHKLSWSRLLGNAVTTLLGESACVDIEFEPVSVIDDATVTYDIFDLRFSCLAEGRKQKLESILESISQTN